MIFGPSRHLVLYFWVIWDKIGNHLRIFFFFLKKGQQEQYNLFSSTFPPCVLYLSSAASQTPSQPRTISFSSPSPWRASLPHFLLRSKTLKEKICSQVFLQKEHTIHTTEASGIFLLSWLFTNSILLSVEVRHFFFFFGSYSKVERYTARIMSPFTNHFPLMLCLHFLCVWEQIPLCKVVVGSWSLYSYTLANLRCSALQYSPHSLSLLINCIQNFCTLQYI